MRVDSLTKFKELIAKGVPEGEAEIIAHGLAQASEVDMSNIATKDDIRIINVHFTCIHIIEVIIFLGIMGILIQGSLK